MKKMIQQKTISKPINTQVTFISHHTLYVSHGHLKSSVFLDRFGFVCKSNKRTDRIHRMTIHLDHLIEFYGPDVVLITEVFNYCCFAGLIYLDYLTGPRCITGLFGKHKCVLNQSELIRHSFAGIP